MNSLNFTGGLGRDCETRFTAKGDAITSFSVALTSGYGESKLTTWLNCSIFGKRGESLAPYLVKGAQVAISGEFSARPYTSKAGEEKLSLEVRVNELTLLGKKDSSDSGGVHGTRTQSKTEQSSAPAKAAPGGNNFDDFEDDIPF
jgi:single-strand DNA-binding protein